MRIFRKHARLLSSALLAGFLMMLQTGGAAIPVMLGDDLPPFEAGLVDENTGKSECSGLKLVGADPVP